MAKTIGIIGGMGPMATIDLLNKIYTNSKAVSDQLHPRVLADIDPTIPDRTQAILSNDRDKISSHLQANARGLLAQGAEILAMPCNTAHAFLDSFEREISACFVNMILVTVEHIISTGAERVGLLATDGTLAARLYVDELTQGGVEIITPDATHQAALMRAIYAFKGGETQESREAAKHIYQILLSRGASQVIAACTELPILLSGEEVIDPTDLLARRLVLMAQGG